MRLKSLSGKVQRSTVFSGVSLNSPYGSNKAQKNPHLRLNVPGCTYRVRRCLTGSFIYRGTERDLGTAAHFRVQRGNCDDASITRGWNKAEEMHHLGALQNEIKNFSASSPREPFDPLLCFQVIS